MTELVFASNNAHKVSEVQAILGNDFNLLSLKDIDYQKEIVEDADTLEGNAAIKARTIWKEKSINCFADDTGLEVDALDGNPGVLSARFAGEAHNDKANLDKLLRLMTTETNRKARFRTVVCLIINGQEMFFEGIVNGEISRNPSGEKGFGYDPVFIPETYDLSFAEMHESEKNAISHRGRVMEKLRDFLISNFSSKE